MAESNAQRARRGYEAARRGELDELTELLDPEVRWHGGDPDGPGTCRGRDQALAFMRRPEMRGPGELLDVIAAGDQVVLIIRPTAGSDGAPEPVANVSTFRNGRVVEMVHYADPAEALAAVNAPAH